MGLRATGWLTVVFACFAAASSSAAGPVKAVTIGAFQSPTYVAAAPGATRLLFVVEQAGRIQVLLDEHAQATPFLDISSFVLFSGEQGLLSLAFAPDYQRSGLFYVFFVNKNGNLEVDEFKRSTSVLRANRSTRRILLAIPHPDAGNHNGGQMQFGPDGLLYISTGDGGNTSTAGEPARNLNNLLGKVLRIDPFHRGGGLPFRIPAGNPFVGKPGRDEIFAYGFRNPWRFAFDRTRIAIGDVGQSQQEEVDFLPIVDAKGVNFGWPQYEGNRIYHADSPGRTQPKFPIFVYPHDRGRCAIIGGFVARGSNLPSLEGRYLYGDACSGEVRAFFANVSQQQPIGDRPAGITLPSLSSFGRGNNGEIYAVQTSGAVSRLVPNTP